MKFNLKYTIGAVLLFTVIGFGTSCQKELSGDSIPITCMLAQYSLSVSGSVFTQYNVTYDTVARRPTVINFLDALTGSQTINVAYGSDTVYLSNGSYLVKDVSNRITYLNELNAPSNARNGEYYYSYKASGQLDTRIFDDGVAEIETLRFSFTQDSLTGFTVDAQGVANIETGVIKYATTPRFTNYPLLQYGEIFPELALYIPIIKLGALTSYPITSITYTSNTSGIPPQTFISSYSNFAFNSDGLPISLQAQVATGAVPAVVPVQYNFDYRCF